MRTISLILATLGLTGTFTLAHADTIFHSGIEPGLTIDGRVYWPGPIAGAVVTARFGDQIATTSSRTDGRFGLVIEHRHVSGTPLVELTARGTGTQAHIEYAGQLGPFDRLLTAAGADEILDIDEEAFANLTPYSTAVSAFMRAENGHLPLQSLAAFERSARSQQTVHIADMVKAIAFAAQGDLPLPAGYDTTWAALTDMAGTQQLYADWYTALYATSCSSQPDAPICTIFSDLVGNSTVFPPGQPVPGLRYAVSNGGGFGFESAAFVQTLSIDGSTGSSWNQFGDGPFAIEANLEGDGRYLLTRQDGEPFSTIEFWRYINGQQVRTLMETESYTVRFDRSAGNLAAYSLSGRMRYRYPDNPEIPTEFLPEQGALPQVSLGNPLPASQSGNRGPLAGKRWLASIPSPGSINSGLDADIHAVNAGGGVTERGSRAFTVPSESADDFTLDYGDVQVVTRLVNEDYPGLWRTELSITSVTGTAYASGILVQVDAPQMAWSAANVPGLYRSRINGHTCNGPWGDIDVLWEYGGCAGTQGWFGFQLNADGTGIQAPNTSPAAVTWTLPGGVDAGRLRIDRMSGATLTQSRGWEVIKVVGDRYWIIENLVQGSSPATFQPSSRVYVMERQ